VEGRRRRSLLQGSRSDALPSIRLDKAMIFFMETRNMIVSDVTRDSLGCVPTDKKCKLEAHIVGKGVGALRLPSTAVLLALCLLSGVAVLFA
jgi:hypothetical protein